MKHGPAVAFIFSFGLALCVSLLPTRGGAEREIHAAMRAQRRDPMVAVALWERAIEATPWTEQIRSRRRFVTDTLRARELLPTPELRRLYDGVWDFGEQLYGSLEQRED